MNMHWRIRYGLLLIGLAVIGGCATAPPVSHPTVLSAAAASGEEHANTAVVALLDDAEIREQAGAYEQSAAVLERALRLEPRNAMLWHRLARVRLKQGQWQNAVDLAAKSNSLAGGDGELQNWNWAVIAEAKLRLGDDEGAAAASAHVSGESPEPK